MKHIWSNYCNKLKRAFLGLIFAALLAVTLALSMMLTENLKNFPVFPAADTGSDEVKKQEKTSQSDSSVTVESPALNIDDIKSLPRPSHVGAKAKKLWLLREHNGKIGIFAYDKGSSAASETPSRVLDVYLFTLPYDEAQRLRHGIVISDADLIYAVEAYTS